MEVNKMGWNNFIALKNLKIMFEVNRQVEEGFEDKKFFENKESYDYIEEHKGLQEITVHDLISLFKCQELVFNSNSQEEIFALSLQHYDDIEIVNEFDLEQHKEKYVGWTIIRKRL
jgi:hypothetical protein